jgi:hypothetical protein
MPLLQGGVQVKTRPFPQQVKEVIEHLPSFFDEDLFMLCLGADVRCRYLKTTVMGERYQDLFSL